MDLQKKTEDQNTNMELIINIAKTNILIIIAQILYYLLELSAVV